jgi:hypothetical protein
LRFVACDSPHFRRVAAVNVTAASTTATSTTSIASQAAMVITLAVEAICYNCTEYMPLFDLPTTDPNGTSKTMHDTNPSKQLQDKTLPAIESAASTCSCAADDMGYSMTMQDYLPILNSHLVMQEQSF